MLIGLIGAGGGCYEIIDLAESCGFTVQEIYDDNKSGIDEKTNISISNKINPKLRYVMSLGDPIIKKKIQMKTRINMVKLLHQYSFIGSRTKTLGGLIMQMWSRISNDSDIGYHVYMNFSSGIAHNCKVGDYVFMGPAATALGYAELGEGAFVGGNSIILNHVKVGEWSIIGAGSVVTKDVPPFEVWVGNPAKFLRKNEDGIREKNKGNI